MTRYIFPYEDYYKQDFIDPLYLPYTQPRYPVINPLTMNTNEIRLDWGQDFRKKYSEYPCPMGFVPINEDYCSRYINQLPHFYTSLYTNIINNDIPLFDFTSYSTRQNNLYPI
jgi:hypothetical protein